MQSRNSLCALFSYGAAIASSGAMMTACTAPSLKPEQQCSAPSTAQGLVGVALNGISVPPAYVHLKLDSSVLDGFDRTTKRVSCSANMSLTFSGQLAKTDDDTMKLQLKGQVVRGQLVVNAKDLLAAAPQTYTIQPAADGGGYVYGLSANAAAAIAAWVIAAKASLPKAEATSSDAGQSSALSQLHRACWKLEGGIQGETAAHPEAVSTAEQGEWAGDVLSSADSVPVGVLSARDRHCIADAKQTPRDDLGSSDADTNEETPTNQQ